MYEYQEKEIWCQRDGLSIYGLAYIPQGEGPWPTVLIAHGFTGTYRDNLNYAGYLAQHGIASYSIDFCGGSNTTRSDGETTAMSVMTEVDDLRAAAEKLKEQDFVDTNNLFLLGESQGGFVAALLAAEMREEIRGVILLYPAFVIRDLGKDRYGSIENIPNETDIWGVRLGRNYFSDLWNLDTYREISQYKGPVLLFHGTEDEIVDLSYSEKARDVYTNAELVVINGLGHGFFGAQAQAPAQRMVQFCRSVKEDIFHG